MKTNVISPIMGAVSTIYVESGSKVEEDELILEIECLKMFTPVHAPASGIISIFVGPGVQVAQDQLLAVIKA